MTTSYPATTCTRCLHPLDYAALAAHCHQCLHLNGPCIPPSYTPQHTPSATPGHTEPPPQPQAVGQEASSAAADGVKGSSGAVGVADIGGGASGGVGEDRLWAEEFVARKLWAEE